MVFKQLEQPAPGARIFGRSRAIPDGQMGLRMIAPGRPRAGPSLSADPEATRMGTMRLPGLALLEEANVGTLLALATRGRR